MEQNTEIKVWDPVVRLFHWGLASAFAIAFVSSEDGLANIHVAAGYVILALVAMRLVWGLIGTRHARFASFVVRPGTALTYLMDMARFRARAYVGHNPAAAWMILALLAGLVVTGVTGMMLYGVEEHAGPLAGLMAPFGGWAEDVLEEAHELFANVTLFLVFFHVTGVLVSSLMHGENLIKAMITGRKPAHATVGGGSGMERDADPSLSPGIRMGGRA